MSQTTPTSTRFPWFKMLVSIVLSSVLLGGAVMMFGALAAMKPEPPKRERPEKVYTIAAYVVEPADLQEIITAFGTTRANREVVIDAQVSGEVVEVRGPQSPAGTTKGLKVGQPVAGPQVRTSGDGSSERFDGDLLLRIDPATYQERVSSAENKLLEDTADLKRLKQEQANNERVLEKVGNDYRLYKEQYNRVKKLHTQGIATDSELNTAELELARYEDALIQRTNEKDLFPSRIELMENRIKTHETDLAIARLDLDRTSIHSPFSGIISEVMVEQGQFVNMGEPLLRITDTSEIEIPLPLTLTDYVKIERKLLAGETPRVELSENETAPKRWIGYVVRRAPEADVASRTIDVYVHVSNHDDENKTQTIDLLPSVFVHARIDGPIIQQSIVVPRDVIRDGKVYVITDLKPAEDEPHTTATDGGAGIELAGTDEREVLVGVAEEREVTIERALRNLAIVRVGLEPGDHVAMTNLDVIHTGAKVRIESRVRLSETLEEQGTPALRRHTLAGGPPKDDRAAINIP